MKIVCDSQKLARQLAIVSKAAASNGNLRVLQNVLLSTEGDNLQLRCSDSYQTLDTVINCKSIEGGAITVSAKQLTAIASKLPEADVDLQIKDNQLVVSALNSVFSLPTIAAEEYPEVTFDEAPNGVSIDAMTLLNALENTMYAVSRDDARGVLTSMLWRFDDTYLTLTATDGHRLARDRVVYTLQEGGITQPVLLGYSTLDKLATALQKSNHNRVHVSLSYPLVQFVAGDIRLTARVSDGVFPTVDNVIPDRFAIDVRFSPDAALEAVDRVQTIMDDLVLRLEIDGHFLKFYGGKTTGTASDRIDIASGYPVKLAVNVKYFQQALQVFKGQKTVSLMLNDPLKPLVVRGQAEHPFCLLMPIQVKES